MKSDILNKTFKRGDIVKIIGNRYGDRYVGTTYKVTKVYREIILGDTTEWVYGASVYSSKPKEGCYFSYELIMVKKAEGFFMNKIIIEMFPKTKDAVLIDKWFGSKINDDPLMAMLIKGKEKELLSEAQRLEKESLRR